MYHTLIFISSFLLTTSIIYYFHKVVNICLANGWLIKSPFTNYKPKIKEVVRDYLLDDEIKSIRDKNITSFRLDLVRDIFLFSCYCKFQ